MILSLAKGGRLPDERGSDPCTVGPDYTSSSLIIAISYYLLNLGKIDFTKNFKESN